MSSFTYTDFVHGWLDPSLATHGRVDVLTDDLILILVDTGLYTPNAGADIDIDDISPGAIIAISDGPITGVDVTDRVLTFDPVTFTAVVGADVNAAVLAKDTGDPSTSPLIAYLDQWASGIPFTPDGSDVEVHPNAAGVIIIG